MAIFMIFAELDSAPIALRRDSDWEDALIEYKNQRRLLGTPVYGGWFSPILRYGPDNAAALREKLSG